MGYSLTTVEKFQLFCANGEPTAFHLRAVQSPSMDTTGLPGAEIVEQGLLDLRGGRETIPSLLVAIASPRLRRLGFPIADEALPPCPEHRLYELLARSGPDSAHSRYNALLRRLVRFERACECAG